MSEPQMQADLTDEIQITWNSTTLGALKEKSDDKKSLSHEM